ncbi:MAG: SDR family NAD(P)-dependent oxidoreductase [Anaerolineae bacterium]|nr:SDR family NAD(P)-dependent oxidoreductase [Anaerolineae bacterium]
MSTKHEQSPVLKYWGQYRWSNVFAMVKNSMADPEICDVPFEGRLVVVTGATSGIGYHTARKFASRGAHVLTINRNELKSAALCEEIRREFGVPCTYWVADLSRLSDMHQVGHALAELETPIDVWIHNAGVYLSKKHVTEDGLEMTFAVNYLASFVMTYLARDKLKAQGSARVIFVNSEGYRFAVWGPRLDDLNWEKRHYTGLRAYGESKIAQLLAMMLFHDDFHGSGVTINAMHPGMVATNTGRDNGPVYRWFKRNLIDRVSNLPTVSGEALYTLGVSPKFAGVSGKFFNLTRPEEVTPPAQDRSVAQALWDISLDMGGLR